jgi:hypothetical protein
MLLKICAPANQKNDVYGVSQGQRVSAPFPSLFFIGSNRARSCYFTIQARVLIVPALFYTMSPKSGRMSSRLGDAV